MAGIRFIQRHGIALLALFIALGGTTYAAVRIPANSVGAKQLKKNAVTRPKIKANAVNGAKIANNSVTGADILESSLDQVPSAAHADSATNATHANSATTAGSAANAANAAHATNADKLGGILASGWQRLVTGTCDQEVKVITSVGADGSVTCGSPVIKIHFTAASGTTNDPGGPTSSLAIGVGCNLPPLVSTIVSFVNTGPDNATLNWVYGTGSGVNASGTSLAAGTGEMDFSFEDARIEGQFVFANGAGVTTVNLHAFDGNASGCEVAGTAEVSG